jgi:outer membrane protein TolC
MFFRKIAFFVWLSVFVPPRIGVPQEIGDPVLDALLMEAAASSPRIAVARGAIERARALPAQAGSLPDPWLSISYQNEGLGPTLGSEIMSFLRFGWSQDLPWSGKRSLRSDVVLRDIEIAEQQLERIRLDVLASVEIAYVRILAARELLQLLREEEEIWRQIEGVARARYGVGQGAQQDVIRVQVELTRIEERRVGLGTEERVSLAELNALAGRPTVQPLEHTASLELHPVHRSLERALEETRGKSPELRGARIGIERARQAISLAERERKPDFRVTGAYMNRGGLPGMWEAGVDVRLPLSRGRWDAMIEEARAALAESEARLEALELSLRARTEQRLAQIEARERIAALYGEGIIPQDRLSVEAALASYRAGAVPFITVLESLSRLYLDRASLVENVSQHHAIRARLDAASIEAEESAFAWSPRFSRGETAGMGGMR